MENEARNGETPASTSQSQGTTKRYVWLLALVVLVFLSIGIVIMLRPRPLSSGSLKEDVITAKSAISAIDLCLLAGPTNVGAFPSPEEMARCVDLTLKEKKQAINTAYVWHINPHPSAWAPGRDSSTEWLLAICDPNSGEPYVVMQRGRTVEVVREIPSEEAQQIITGWIRVNP